MNRPRKRKLGALLIWVCAAMQPAAASASLAGALTMLLHGYDHAHAIAVVADDGHVDLVLSHEHEADASHRAPHSEDAFHPLSEGDHVLHMNDSDDATARRIGLDPSPALEIPAAVPPAPDPVVVGRAAPHVRIADNDSLGTVVLRL